MAYNAELYTHDLDRKALIALNTFPKIVKIRELYTANVDEKKERILYLSSAIRLSEKQMPEIYGLLPPVCEKLGINVPELYYIKKNEMNAWTFGSVKPYICITSSLVDALNSDQISSVLAHECGHIACKHSLYHSLARLLAKGIDDAVAVFLPGIRRLVTPALIKALLFWERCSELSADRAAVLCDGEAQRTVGTLLRIHGYGDNINVDEFIHQAIDLRTFLDESVANKALEQMLIQEDDHPRLATRAYECYEWAKSSQYQRILNGTYTLADRKKSEEKQVSSDEIIAAEVKIEASNRVHGKTSVEVSDDLDAALSRVNQDLERYTNRADKTDYAFAVASGLLTGCIDAVFVGEMKIADGDIGLSHKQVNLFIEKYAEKRGLKGPHLKNTIANLEDAFPVLQDNVWKGAGIGVSAKNHHLADLAHHPTPLGLVSAIVVEFFRVGTFVNKDGELHFLPIQTSAKDMLDLLVPAVMTGVLNWLVVIGENKYAEEIEDEVPEYIRKLAHIAASTPILVEVAKCADNWFGHLVSDMGGSKQTAGGGMGIPGVFVSLLYEVAALPGLKDSGLPQFINTLYEKQRLDLRHEVVIYKELGRQAIPVIFNEILVRLSYFLVHLAGEVSRNRGLHGIKWNQVIPFGNRTVDRMLTVASMTFTVADTADAAVRAALESGGNWVLFAGRFVTRFNYIGAGRAAVAVVKEISNERKEAELIHEKLILTEAKTSLVMQQLQEYKAALEERVSQYLADDIEAFMTGFDYMNQGLAAGDSDLVIYGNVIIQRVLGRQPQFTTQEEFDALMDSDIPLTL